MTLPAPGSSISANQINVEATRSGTANAPMSGSSATPQAGSLVKLYASPFSDVNQSAPHSYSEFYSKTWTALTSTYSSSVVESSGALACTAPNPINQTYYHNGSGAYPVPGDFCFSDSAATPLANGYYKTSEFTSTSLGGIFITTHLVTGEPGMMYSTFSCLQSYSSSVNSTLGNVCSATIDQVYYHNGGIGSTLAVNDTVYTSNTGTTNLSSGYYRISSTEYIIVSASGNVDSINTCTTVTSFSSSTGASIGSVCALSIGSTYYHDGSGTYPAAGDTVYSDSAGTIVLANNYYKFNSTWAYRITGGAGVVDASWPQEIC